MSELYEKLKQYSKTDAYPFHMPGHKRQWGKMENPYSFDITEISGFDDLHHAEGILKEAMEEAASVYGAKKSYFLINGSTSGILSGICGCTNRGDKVLVARNCHKSVYHSVFLRGLHPVYIYPQMLPGTSIFGGLTAKSIEEMLKTEPDIKAVILTSPTYEGVVSDIREIAQVVHAFGIPLIVDEAHGAHLPFGEKFPESAITRGADVVIQSLHKTLPSLTQTAILHVGGEYADTARIEEYLRIYQTSSPSYVLMSSIDNCISYMAGEGRQKLKECYVKVSALRETLCSLKKLHLLSEDEVRAAGFEYDISKLVVLGGSTGLTGQELADILREEFHLEAEMSTDSFVLLMTTVADTDEGLKRLEEALFAIDAREAVRPVKQYALPCVKPEQAMTPAEAEAARGTRKLLEESAGYVSKTYLYLYPPGIPLLVPGEIISTEILSVVQLYSENNLELHGLSGEAGISGW